MKTYTSTRNNPIAFVREAYHLYRIKALNMPSQINWLISQMNTCEGRLKEATGITLENLKVLNIGPGQTPREMAYLGMRNEVIGIDLDVIPQKFTAGTYLTMLKQNGFMRTLKTLVRKSIGIDFRFTQELKKQLGLSTLPRTSCQQMDAANMTFPDGSFDLAYSFSVFEHLPDPGKVLDEIIRVLRPGGGCYISLHMYSSEDGCHDMRIFADDREGIPYWSHLRPPHKELIQANAYMNEIRLEEWKQLFESRMPGVTFYYDTHDPAKIERLQKQLASIRSAGELQDYRDEELLNVNLIATWKKPDTNTPEASLVGASHAV